MQITRPGADTSPMYLDKIHIHWKCHRYRYRYIQLYLDTYTNVSRYRYRHIQMYLDTNINVSRYRYIFDTGLNTVRENTLNMYTPLCAKFPVESIWPDIDWGQCLHLALKLPPVFAGRT